MVVTSHRQKSNGQVVSELAVSNTRGAKQLGQIPPKLKAPEIHVEPLVKVEPKVAKGQSIVAVRLQTI